MSPIDAACMRLQSAASGADERDRCSVKGADLRLLLKELAQLQETLATVEIIPDLEGLI